MKKNTSKQMSVKDLIALCHIIDDYEEFIKNLEDFISNEKNMFNIHKLGIVSRGEFCFGSRKIKQFYKQNKNVIDQINECSGITRFILSNYNIQGKQYERGLNFFYEYIYENKNHLNDILALLNKIDELNIKEVELNEDFDFTSVGYESEIRVSSPNHNHVIPYFDNIEIIPNYDNYIVNYRTTYSDYFIKVFPSHIDDKFNVDQIKVRTLLFDPNRLPKEITKETTFDKILELKKLQKENCELVKKSVNLSIGVVSLENQFSFTRLAIEQLADIKNNPEMIEVLSEMKENIEKLQLIKDEYNRNASEENDFITVELIEKEKRKQLQNLEKSRIHSCW